MVCPPVGEAGEEEAALALTDIILNPVKAAPIFGSITDGPLGARGLEDLIARLQGIVSLYAGIAAIGVVIWGATLYILAFGEPDKIKKAKQVLTYGALGVVFILMANIAVRVFIVLLGGKA